ncbi:MAG: hypothetical protein JNK65_09855 [Deltaproteobacteria bacterium]|nr:hypothetical protein [Deltaproteobacteria bacterium]
MSIFWNHSLGNYGQESLLSRLSSPSLLDASLTSTQQRIDQSISAFSEQLSDFKTIAAMSAGSVFFNFGRLAVLSSANNTTLVQATSHLVGLGAEVLAFEGSHHFLSRISGAPMTSSFYEGLSSSFVNFGMLKIMGRMGQRQNLILRHLLSDLGVVAGHQAAYTLGFSPQAQGSFLEQMVQAQTLQFQLGMTSALFRQISPHFFAFERSLDLISRTRIEHFHTNHEMLPPGLPVLEGPRVALSTRGLSPTIPEIFLSTMKPSELPPPSYDSGRSTPQARRSSTYRSVEQQNGKITAWIEAHLTQDQVQEILKTLSLPEPSANLEEALSLPRVRGRLLAEVVNSTKETRDMEVHMDIWHRTHRMIEYAYMHFDFVTVRHYLDHVRPLGDVSYAQFVRRISEIDPKLTIYDDFPLDLPGQGLVPRVDSLRDLFLRQVRPADVVQNGREIEVDMGVLNDPEALGLAFTGTFRNAIVNVLTAPHYAKKLAPGISLGEFLIAPFSTEMGQRVQRVTLTSLQHITEFRRILLRDSSPFHLNFLRSIFQNSTFDFRVQYEDVHSVIRQIPPEQRTQLQIDSLPELAEIDALLGIFPR